MGFLNLSRASACVCWILFFTDVGYCMPKPTSDKRSSRQAPAKLLLGDAARYLSKYGYLSKSRTSQALSAIETLEPSALSAPIKRFQRMAGISATGRLDGETMRFMSMSRCGVDDTAGAFSMGSRGYDTRGKYGGRRRKKDRGRGKNRPGKVKSRTKRYDLQGSSWRDKTLTYKILNYTSDMTKSQVRLAVRRALNLWAEKSSLKFKKSTGDDADIKISFGKKAHGDRYPFDGPGGTLAHAFFPESGLAHFDDDENFSHKGEGTNLYIVAAHEFGHSLGLGHSTVPDSLMAPFYQGYVEDFELHPDDIAAIRKIYGKNVDKKMERPDGSRNRPTSAPKQTKPTKKPRTNIPDLCKTNIDATISYLNNSKAMTYVFKGSYYYKIDDYGVVEGYPKKIGKRWEGLPGNLNAASHSSRTGYTYFFKGDKVYSYYGRTPRRGFPRKSKSLGLPTHPNAVLSWGSDGMLYMFKKKIFYVFDDYAMKTTKSRHIASAWRGLPEGIDSAFTWARNSQTYFLKDNSYWRFNNNERVVANGYPQDFNKHWLRCKKEVLRELYAAKYSDKGSKKNGRADKRSRGP